MKDLLKLKSFRKNFIFMFILLIIVRVSNYFNSDAPISAGGILKTEIFSFAVYFIACFIVDLITEMQSRKGRNKQNTLFKLTNLKRTLIPVCCLLAFLCADDFFNKAIPYTTHEIIIKYIFLILFYLIACFIIDLVTELRSRHDKKPD